MIDIRRGSNINLDQSSKSLEVVILFLIGLPIVLVGMVIHLIVFLFCVGWVIGNSYTRRFKK